MWQGCYRGALTTVFGCLFNLTDHPPYQLLRYAREIEEQADHTSANHSHDDYDALTIEFDNVEYVKTTRTFSFVSSKLDLYIFLPVEYWTEKATRAIVIALSSLTVIAILGFFCSFWALRTISSRIEHLAESMAEDPFSGPPLLGVAAAAARRRRKQQETSSSRRF